MFFISNYLDGERWESGLEPLLYPTGTSFYRPFSYKRQYFHPEIIADQLTEPSQRDSLLRSNGNNGLFGVRFLNAAAPEYLPIFIPLRRVSLIGVDASDQINVSFKLGPYVAPSLASGDGRQRGLPKINLMTILPDPKLTKLFISLQAAQEEALPKFDLKNEFPAGLWEVLEGAVSPPAKEKILNTFLARLVRIRRRGDRAELAATEVDPISGTCGFHLTEGTAYDLLLAYFRIVERGVAAPPAEHQWIVTNPVDELQSSRRIIQVNSNYRNEEIWIRPRSAGPGPVLVSLEPSKLGEVSPADPRAAKMLPLKIPVLVGPEKWSVAKKWNLSIAAVCLLALAICFWKYPGSSEAVILLLISAFIALLINSVKDLVVPKK